jgi:hypothetical protein
MGRAPPNGPKLAPNLLKARWQRLGGPPRSAGGGCGTRIQAATRGGGWHPPKVDARVAMRNGNGACLTFHAHVVWEWHPVQ